ncbi:radical SAM protein [Deferribacteraceae bacterium V6Fe1]|nr:radical SAM protein [Deferribacteraceae bacterium V6Fe1]
MKFLNRNHYALIFGEKCNLACSYCSYGLNKKNADKFQSSAIENNISMLVKILENLGNVAVTVSGGEPALFSNFPQLIKKLPKIKWIVFTNLTILPEWYFDDNISLLVPSYHNIVDKLNFLKNIKLLKREGKRMHCKIIVHPNNEYRDLDLFEKLWEISIPTSFVPLEYTYFFREEFLKSLITKYRTSLLYNSRFFRLDYLCSRKCKAGTLDGFQINSDCTIVRCSTNQIKISDIFNFHLYSKKVQCNVNSSCYCEWHHWNEWTLANDNEIWSDYVTKGIYKKPTIKELYEFIIKMRWLESGRNLESKTTSLFEGVL